MRTKEKDILIKMFKKGAVNGWRFWKYKNAKGELVEISNLRK